LTRPITASPTPELAIGELSRRTGVHVETIRYYERIGMLPAPPRTPAGRRIYDADHRRQLGFIRRSRELGFTLDEIRALLELGGSARAPCAEVREIAGRHLVGVRAKLADLARLEAILSDTVALCVRNDGPACPVLDFLEAEGGGYAGGRPLGRAANLPSSRVRKPTGEDIGAGRPKRR
jgi:MerR family transcriptional regulator, mercuric resistance operon regulatory protein